MKLLITAIAAFGLGWFAQQSDKPAKPQVPDVKVWHVGELQKQRAAKGGPWMEFLKIPSMSCGIYELAKGARDGQQPHRRDELYYVARGKAKLRSNGKHMPVKTGSVIFVRKGADHRFTDIEEPLSLVVFFASEAVSKQPAAN